MKIAYIIQCHKEPEQINCLFHALDYKDNYLFVHVDAKSNIKDRIIRNTNIFILDECIDVKWGQISQVQATLLLFTVVIKSEILFDYVWLISGQDFPIKSNEYIHNYLEANKGCNFCTVYFGASGSWLWQKRIAIYYPQWFISNMVFPCIIRRLWVLVTGGNKYTFPFFRRKNITNRQIFFGSQWFTITYDCMCFILSTVKKEPEIMKFFKNTRNPDECFFQTILMNSCYGDTVRENLLYVDFSNGNSHPKDLNDSDFQILRDSPKLIARKFDSVNTVKSLEAFMNIS